ncbi:integral membrane protein [Ophiostoma piceae UAMH 11346]|uniref:Integral membrane protein n=1 Tax=Ophiostoma piceae (strain UAMH 11346) TaxID=1262450 RepID=S3CR83_OPHP1|nr:integral membrane protein [Ophiostoma piceae UAMH 11346]
MSATYYGWVPPTSETANFTDCGLAAQYLANLLYYSQGANAFDMPFNTSYNYILSFVPSYLDTPTYGQAAQWLEDVLRNDLPIYGSMLNYPLDHCPEQVCRKMTWDGDPDLIGIGVVVVYYLAAILTTLHVLILSVNPRIRPLHTERYERWRNRFVSVFHDSLATFLDTGLLFSIAMLVGAVYRYGSARVNPEKTHSPYQLMNAAYMGIFNVLPPFLLQLVMKHRRRQGVRNILWVVILVLGITLISLYWTSLGTDAQIYRMLTTHDSAVSDFVWEYGCNHSNISTAFKFTLIAAVVTLIFNSAFWVWFGLPARFRAKLNSHKTERRKSIVRKLSIISSCLLMWTLLGLFTAYRSILLEKMPNAQSSSSWSFGQMLALATWVPVGIDMYTILRYGPQEAIEDKVSDRFCVVAAGQVQDQFTAIEAGKGDAVMTAQEVAYDPGRDPYQMADSMSYAQLSYTNAYGQER